MKPVWVLVVVVGLAAAQDEGTPSAGDASDTTQVRAGGTTGGNNEQNTRFLSPQAVGGLLGAGQALLGGLLGGGGPVQVSIGQPGQFGGRPGQFGGRPGQFGGRPGQFGGRPGQFGGQPGQFGGQFGQFGGRPVQFGGRPGQFGGRPVQFGGRPGQFGGQFGQFGGRPVQFGGRPGQFGGRPGQFGQFGGNQFGTGFAVVKPGQCPPVRPQCPPTRSFAPPSPCNSDSFCSGVDKCCFDTCLQQRVCKPPRGVGR